MKLQMEENKNEKKLEKNLLHNYKVYTFAS